MLDNNKTGSKWITQQPRYRYVKYRNLAWFHGVEILRKGTVSAEFWTIRPKLCGNCDFRQNFHTMKLGKITVFYTVYIYDNVKHLWWRLSKNSLWRLEVNSFSKTHITKHLYQSLFQKL